MTDPIADMLTRIRNAAAVRKSEVILPTSKIKVGLADILKKEKFISDFSVIDGQKENDKFKYLKIVLSYENNQPKIQSLKRISKPGLKIYAKRENLPRVLNDFGIAIISTSSGLMTNKEARKKKLGGEIICEIY